MATKDLARTVIEGGRSGYSKSDRRVASRALRGETRSYLSLARPDPEAVDATPPPVRMTAMREFNDRLSAAYRFLDSRLGRSWNKTRALLVERFDARTTAGRHLLHDHILRDVAPSKNATAWSWGTRSYYLDRHGVLRKVPPRRWRDRPVIHFDRAGVLAWLAGRRVGRVGAHLFWYVAVRDADNVRVSVASRHVVFTYAVEGAKPDEPIPPFRQAGALAKADVAFFEGLPSEVQEAILRYAPVAPARQVRH